MKAEANSWEADPYADHDLFPLRIIESHVRRLNAVYLCGLYGVKQARVGDNHHVETLRLSLVVDVYLFLDQQGSRQTFGDERIRGYASLPNYACRRM